MEPDLSVVSCYFGEIVTWGITNSCNTEPSSEVVVLNSLGASMESCLAPAVEMLAPHRFILSRAYSVPYLRRSQLYTVRRFGMELLYGYVVEVLFRIPYSRDAVPP